MLGTEANVKSAPRVALPLCWEEFSYSYPDATSPALNQVSLSIEPGERVLLMGASGCGKSTLGLTLNGIIPRITGGHSTGRIRLGNKEPQDNSLAAWAAVIGYVFQDPDSQLCTITTRDEIAFGPQNLLVERQEILRRLQETADLVGLGNRLYDWVFDLSGGQKQRVAIAAALVMQPSILVLDEPTANLDPAGRAEVFRIMQALSDQTPMTTIIAEHHPGDLLAKAERLVIMKEGSVIYNGAPRAVLGAGAAEIKKAGIRLPAATSFWADLGRPDLPVFLSPSEINFDQVAGPSIGQLPPLLSTQPSTGPTPALRLDQVGFSYHHGSQVLRGISFDLDPGEILAVLGANGSGKSTMASLLVGLNRPQRGHIFVDGIDIARLSIRDLSRHVGYVFQYPEHQFITDNVLEEVAISIRRLDPKARNAERQAAEQLEKFDLGRFADRHPLKLSQGQQRRLSIAAMAVYRPKILVLDEPTFGQDQAHTDQLSAIINELSLAGTAVLLITHDLSLTAQLAHRTIVMAEGQIAFDGSTVSLLESLRNGARWHLEPPEEYELWRSLAIRLPNLPFTIEPGRLARSIPEHLRPR